MDVCVGLCLLWVAGGIIFNIFEVVPECLDIPLLIFVQRSHKELCQQKPARQEERTKDVVCWEWDYGVESQSVGSRTKTQSSADDD